MAVFLGVASAGHDIAEKALSGLEPPPHRVQDPPAVSAICPTLNEEGYIERWLTCIRNQTLPPQEVIVVDYESTDDTRGIAESFGARVIPISESGVGPARDLGALHARSDVLFFSDADAVFENRLIEECYRSLIEGWDIVHVPGSYYDTNNPIIQAGRTFFRFYKNPRICDGFATMTTKDVWRSINGWELPVGEESWFGRKAEKAGFKIKSRKDLCCATSARLWWGESRTIRKRY